MAFAVSRTDTGQFVLQDPRTDTVVIDDDLVAGFERLEQLAAERAGPGGEGGDPGPSGGPSAFAFRGGPRYAVLVLAVVLPFVWLGVFYLSVASLVSEQALGSGDQRATEDRVEALEAEVQALRSEIASAPRMGKSKAKRRGGDKVTSPKKTEEGVVGAEPVVEGKLDTPEASKVEAVRGTD